jgi:sec-independent protein translocase protein TatA
MGVGGGQILIIAIILVVLFVAPARLPGLGKSLAQAIKGFKKGITDDDDETDVTESVKREKLDESESEPVAKKKTEKEKV